MGDFNGDGKQDLAVANGGSNNVSILLGDGAGSFSPATSFASANNGQRSVAVGDFNGDGKQDLAVVDGVGVSILLVDGAGHFSAATEFGAGSSPQSVAVGDFNGDGKQDIVINNGFSDVSILLGDGTGNFSGPTSLATGGSNTAAVGDFNGDGKQDLAVVAGFGPSIFLNQSDPCSPSCQLSTSISANFNGTPISGGKYIWFNGVLKPSGLGANPVTIRFTQQTITSATFTLSVPDATVTFDPAASSATTTFSGGMWVTRAPSSGLAGNTFLSALGYLVPANLPGGIHNVTWNGTISSDTPGVSVQWKWAAAVYSNFISDYNTLGVKPVDDNKASQYHNSDHAGTPENFKPYVIGGATGGGGSNYTGGYSGTVSVGPCP